MTEVWEHSELGRFEFEEYEGWRGSLELADAALFIHDGDPTVDFVIEADEPDELPTDELIDVALKSITNHGELLRAGLQALFEDLHDRGRDSGMWWRGAKDQVYDIVGNDFPTDPLASPEGLVQLLPLTMLTIQELGDG